MPIHKSRGGCSLKSWTYAMVVRPLSVLYSVLGTQALEVVPVTGTGGGWRASSRGGAKAGKRPRNRMWNDASAGSERCPWVWPSVMGIGAPTGLERGPRVSARVLSRGGAAWTDCFLRRSRGAEMRGGWITARSGVVIDGWMMEDAVVGDVDGLEVVGAVDGAAVVGDAVVGDAVVGDAVVGEAVVGDAVVGVVVVGDAIVGDAVVADAVVGDVVVGGLAQRQRAGPGERRA